MNTNANTEAGQAPSLVLPGVDTPETSRPFPAKASAGGLAKRWRKRAFAILAVIPVTMAMGLSYRFIQSRADANRFPQEGRSVDIGGFSLNINCTGQGSPTVILEAGLGVPAISWRAVQRDIAKFTRVCSYDRAGYDWSDPGPMPRTTAKSVTELHTLLQNAGEQPPYVLVGHSYGGTVVRIYNERYPGEVAGMVLADTGHEDLKFPQSFQAAVDNELERRRHDRKWARPLHWFGVDRFLASENIDNPALGYDQQEWWYFLSQPGFIAAAASELENVDEGKAELRAAGTLGNKPLIVLIAAKSMLDLPLPPQDLARLHSSWDEFEMRLASLSSRGKWIVVPDSGHMIPFDRPDAIVSAAREVYGDTRSPQ